MGSAGVVRAMAAVLAAGVAGAALTGCGSVSSVQGSTAEPYLPTTEHEPASAAGGGDPFAKAVALPINADRVSSVTGQLSSTGQVDVYDIGPVYTGDRIHVEVLGSASLDAAVAVLDAGENILITNDDRSYYGGLIDPLADALIQRPSERCYVAVAVSPKSGRTGGYTLDVLVTEGDAPDLPEPQHVYFNFDGADNVTIGSRAPVDVPVFDAASISPAYSGDTDAIVAYVMDMVRADYQGLNVYFYSSRDGPPPDGPYSTLHFGHYDPDLLGVAENIDEYNLAVSQEAIIFTDTFAAFMVLSPSVEEIAQALANVASHETGHLLGLYHCTDTRAVMDVTASLRQMLGDQAFARAPLHDEYFPVGYQDAVQMLIENVGGDVAVAKQAAAARLNQRSAWYDVPDGPPARDKHVFGTCAQCLNHKAGRLSR